MKTVRLPIRPQYIKMMITAFERKVKFRVTPVLIPTVPIAERHSNTASVREISCPAVKRKIPMTASDR